MEIKVKGKNYLFQWDCGQVLTITGGPARYVDFSAPGEPDGVIRIEVQDGECPIPDKWLQTAGNRTIWVCLADDSLVSATLRVRSRPKPPDYIPTDDKDEKRVNFDTLLKRAGNAIQAAEEATLEAKEAIKDAAAANELAGKAVEDANAAVEKTTGAVTAAAEHASKAAGSDASAQKSAKEAKDAAQEALGYSDASKAAATLSAGSMREAMVAKSQAVSASDSSRRYADEAKQAAVSAQAALAEKGWIHVELRVDGHLYAIVENIDTVTLSLKKGRLIANYG